MPFVIKALMSGGLSAQRPVVFRPTTKPVFHIQHTSHPLFRRRVRFPFLTFSGRRIIPIGLERGGLEPPTGSVQVRDPTLHLSFHLTSIVPCLHLYYSILFKFCQEGILNFISKNKGVSFYRREHSSLSPLDSRFKRIPLDPIG